MPAVPGLRSPHAVVTRPCYVGRRFDKIETFFDLIEIDEGRPLAGPHA